MTGSRYAALLLVSVILCSVAPASETSMILLDGVAAVVNERIITVGDVVSAVEPMKRRMTFVPGSKEYDAEVRRLIESARESLIDKFLILDSEDATKIVIPDWYVDRRVNEIVKESFGGEWSRLMEVLARDRQTVEQWRAELKDHILISSIRQIKIEQSITVSPTEVMDFYIREKDRFALPGRVRLRMIVLERKDGADDPVTLAGILKGRIEKGEDFAELARKYSAGTYAQQGGDWGWTETGILREDIREAADSAKAGEPVILETGSEVFIFRVEDRQEFQPREFKDVQPLAERELKRMRAESEIKNWMDVLRKSAFVKINDMDFE